MEVVYFPIGQSTAEAWLMKLDEAFSSLCVVLTPTSKWLLAPAVSLALCDLRPEEEDCETSSCSYIHCELTITVGTEETWESWPYFYICEESLMPLGTRSLDRVYPSIVLRPLHQVTQSSPSPDFAHKSWPVDWWDHQELQVGVDMALGPVLLSEGTVPLWIPASLHIKASLSFQVFKRTSEKSMTWPTLFLLRF